MLNGILADVTLQLAGAIPDGELGAILLVVSTTPMSRTCVWR